MKNYLKIAVLFAVALCLPQLSHAQAVTLNQTTLSATVNSTQTQLQLGSLTGISGYAPNLSLIPFTNNVPTHLYIDREEIEVRFLPATGTVVQVRRGVNGTVANAHQSATMVLSGPATAFFTYDPGGNPGGGAGGAGGGACSLVGTSGPNGIPAVPVTPWINVRSGAQWLCSTVTNTWVPGFNNPNMYGNAIPTAAVASAAGLITPSGPLFHVTGTAAITGFNIPLGCNATAVGSCSFTIIPDAVFTYTAANNIGLASTGLNAGTAVVVVNQPITFIWDAKNSKFLPNTQ